LAQRTASQSADDRRGLVGTARKPIRFRLPAASTESLAASPNMKTNKKGNQLRAWSRNCLDVEVVECYGRGVWQAVEDNFVKRIARDHPKEI